MSIKNYINLLETITEECKKEDSLFLKDLQNQAVIARERTYGKKVYIRGLIEISNICKNDCYYCGIRKSNQCINRYRLTKEEILNSCKAGYELGFRTFVMQGGEDGYYDDKTLVDIIQDIKSLYQDCAVTLSLGERSRESYKELKKAGADRYLLRHETADKNHYELLHPDTMSYENRMRCLDNLMELGYQVGCGFMVGSPYQTVNTLAADLNFIENFKPHMVGIGPFIPTKNTPFEKEKIGTVMLTTSLLSVLRIMNPSVLLPSTTALASLDTDGRLKGIEAGANVIMPNLSPQKAKSNYRIYDNKVIYGNEMAQNIEMLKNELAAAGYTISINRGDYYEKESN